MHLLWRSPKRLISTLSFSAHLRFPGNGLRPHKHSHEKAPHVANWYVFQPPKPSYAFTAASLSINRNFGEKGTVFLGLILHRLSSGNFFSYFLFFYFYFIPLSSCSFTFSLEVLAAFHQVRRLVAKFSLRKTSRLLASAKNDPDTLRRWKTGDSHLSHDLACVSETLLDALSPYI